VIRTAHPSAPSVTRLDSTIDIILASADRTHVIGNEAAPLVTDRWTAMIQDDLPRPADGVGASGAGGDFPGFTASFRFQDQHGNSSKRSNEIALLHIKAPCRWGGPTQNAVGGRSKIRALVRQGVARWSCPCTVMSHPKSPCRHFTSKRCPHRNFSLGTRRWFEILPDSARRAMMPRQDDHAAPAVAALTPSFHHPN